MTQEIHYKKITYLFKIPKERQIKMRALIDETATKQDIIDTADGLFMDAMKHAGKTDAEIESTNYLLSVIKGWC